MAEPGKALGGGRYRIDSILGQGGMGAVYLAHQEALSKRVAIKEMELRGLSESELRAAVKQFQSEATFLANLDHPNLVQVTDFFVEEDKHYLVMAYVSGQTLQQKLRVRGKPFSLQQVLEYARPLCDVLTYLHSQNPPILFRDLKPSNIMVEDSGRLKLIDFGIARTSSDGERTSTFLKGTGTSGFSPIEQYGGHQSTDHRSDIYSLGATIYQLVTGQVPPDAVSRISQGAQVQNPSELFPELSTALDAVLIKSLAMNKQERHQSVAEFARALEAAGRGQGDDSETEDLRPLAMVSSRAAPGLGEDLTPTVRSSPNITVELVPTGAPPGSPTQIAAALGGAAVLVLLLGSFLMPKLTGEVAPEAATPTSRPPLAASAGENGSRTAQQTKPETTPTRGAVPTTLVGPEGHDVEDLPAGERIRRSPTRGITPGEQPPSEVPTSAIRPPKPARVAARVEPSQPAYPTVRRIDGSAASSPPLEEPSWQEVPPAAPPLPPGPAQEPPWRDPAGPLTHRDGDPPDIYYDDQGRPVRRDGRPLKMGSDGRPLPREMQDGGNLPPGEEAPPGAGAPPDDEGPRGYNTRRREPK